MAIAQADFGAKMVTAEVNEAEALSPVMRKVAAMIRFTRAACRQEKFGNVFEGGADRLGKLQMQLQFHMAKVKAGLADVMDPVFIKAARELEEIAIKARSNRRNPKWSIENLATKAV